MPVIRNVAGTVVLDVDLILRGFEDQSEAGNFIHHIVGSDGDPDVSLAPDRMPTGTLRAFFTLDTAALAARDALRLPDVWELENDPAVTEMRFVRSGVMRRVQQDAMKRWVLEIGYQEVSA